ncbi:MAG TPA: hypothetical protein VLF94_03650 [Chlamydiales bacterium]|nr:hypothetical protein [Chlamydiales bacterium]
MQQFPKKEGAPDFSNPAAQQAFVQDTQTSKSLLQKELDTNHAEQNLLNRRIQLMKSLINDLPSSDPQYTTLLTQVQMDQVELDELKVRATLLSQTLSA